MGVKLESHREENTTIAAIWTSVALRCRSTRARTIYRLRANLVSRADSRWGYLPIAHQVLAITQAIPFRVGTKTPCRSKGPARLQTKERKSARLQAEAMSPTKTSIPCLSLSIRPSKCRLVSHPLARARRSCRAVSLAWRWEVSESLLPTHVTITINLVGEPRLAPTEPRVD